MTSMDMTKAVHWRKTKNRIFFGIIVILTVVCVLPLFMILGYVVYRALPGFSMGFFTRLPAPTGIPGGMANAIVGTLEIVAVASIISLPFGLGAGLFLSETRAVKIQSFIRFLTDVLSGTPSIVIGLLAYALIVAPMGNFSGFAGSIALAILMIPTIARTSEQVLRLVPVSLREAALALGATRVQVWMRVVIPTALSGILTGFLLAVSRALGETAPLLFTALGNQFWAKSFFAPMAALPLQVFVYAISPYKDWQQEAWAGALTLVLIALVLNVLARLIGRTKR